MDNKGTVNIFLYSGVKTDPSYGQLHRFNESDDNVQVVASMYDASVAKLTYPVRMQVDNMETGGYLQAFNADYIRINFKDQSSTGDANIYGFVTNVEYSNADVALIYYEIDYYNTYYQDFMNSSAFIKQTSAKVDNRQGKLDTPTLDHTTPNTLLTRIAQPVDHTTVEVYYYDDLNAGEAYRPQGQQVNATVTANGYQLDTTTTQANAQGDTYTNYGVAKPTLKYDLKRHDFDAGNINAGKLTPQKGLRHITFDHIADIIANPALYNSDGSSKILYAELHEHYGSETFTFDVTQDLQAKKVLNTENPFVDYKLTIGNSTQTIPSRYLTNGRLTVKHQYTNDPGSPDLFMIGTDNVTDKTMNIGKLKTPLVLNGVWAKFYKQRNRLNNSAQNLINNIEATVKNFLLDHEITDQTATIGKAIADNGAAIAKYYGGKRTDNDNHKSLTIIGNNYTLSTDNFTASQNAAAKQIANTLATSIENTNRLNTTAEENMAASNSTQLANQSAQLGVSRTNLRTNQSAQAINLINNKNTNSAKIAINVAKNFFDSAEGALLSGDAKKMILGVLMAIINGSVNEDIAQDVNDLEYTSRDEDIPADRKTSENLGDPVNKALTPDKNNERASDLNVNIDKLTGAQARLQRVQNAQRITLDASNQLAITTLNNSQKTAQANLKRSNLTRSTINQNNANTGYSNQKIGFDKDRQLIDNGNQNQKANQSTSYANNLTQLGVSKAESLAGNANSLAHSLRNIWEVFGKQAEKLQNTINAEVQNFNNEINALLADAQDDKTLVGSADDAGLITNGLRDVIFTAYYQGDTINDENNALIQRYGLTVNQKHKIGDVVDVDRDNFRPLIEPAEDDPAAYIYLQGDNLAGMYNCPVQARQTLQGALQNGCLIFKH